MTIADIDSALIQAYQAAALGLATAYPGEHFTPPDPADGLDWAEVQILPAGTRVATLGNSGEDEHTGIFQIDFYTRHGTGRATLTGYYEAMRAVFPVGWLTYSGQDVYISSTERANIYTDGAWQRVAVSVNWLSRTFRP